MSSHELKQLEAAIAAADHALSIQQQCFDKVVQSHEDLLNDEDAKQLDTYKGDVAASKRDLRNPQRALTKAHSERTQLDFMLASTKTTAASIHNFEFGGGSGGDSDDDEDAAFIEEANISDTNDDAAASGGAAVGDAWSRSKAIVVAALKNNNISLAVALKGLPKKQREANRASLRRIKHQRRDDLVRAWAEQSLIRRNIMKALRLQHATNTYSFSLQ
jgi:hypothetical protein